MKRPISVLFFLSFFVVLVPLRAQEPAVPAELGGPGFETIAAGLGWKTGGFADRDLRYVFDPAARKGGSIRGAIPDYPATFRAYGRDENSQVTRLIHGLVYEPLLDVNMLTMEFLPRLATHWKVEEDGLTFRFRLDPKARFADGMPVTAADVLATYELAVDPLNGSLATRVFYESFSPPEAISPYIFTVRARNRNWKNLLYFGGTSILPAHILDTIDGREYVEEWNYRMPPGSGPYQVRGELQVEGTRVTLTRRSDWWKLDDPAYAGQYNFDTISLTVYRDERRELEAFREGEFDFYLIRRAQWYEEEFDFDEARRGLVRKRRIFNEEPQGISGLVFNMRVPPFDDPRVREAVCCLFNREGIVRDMLYNAYDMIDSYYPGSVYANPNNPKVRYDPEKAARLLAEAGYTGRNREGVRVHTATGRPLLVSMPVTHDALRIMTPVREELKKAGIGVNFRIVDGPTQFSLLNSRDFNMAYMNWGGVLYPNPRAEFHSELADIPNTSNLAGFRNARADSLMELEQVTSDQAGRVKILRELDSILMASHMYALGWYAPFTRVAYWNRFGQPDFYLGKGGDWGDMFRVWWHDPEKEAGLQRARRDTGLVLPTGETDVRFWQEYTQEKEGEKEE